MSTHGPALPGDDVEQIYDNWSSSTMGVSQSHENKDDLSHWHPTDPWSVWEAEARERMKRGVIVTPDSIGLLGQNNDNSYTRK